MVTKVNNEGLLSKMVKFVRNPTKDWSDLDEGPPTEQDSGYTKQALKEMIERKRQNDFVRRREFDYLRKLRRNGVAITTERPSFFQNSATFSQNGRATTLKKIDEIEAHMSKQWWRGKQGEVGIHVDAEPSPPVATEQEAQLTFAATLMFDVEPEADSGPTGDYESTQMGLSTSPEGAPDSAAAKHAQGRKQDAGLSEFSTSNLFSFDSSESLADPEMEEAAIRFANGDDAGAEVGLLAALQNDNVPPQSADNWAAALFDLYRATGQQASFDRVAIDYALRFGRSAPAWFSTPDLLGHKMKPALAGRVAALGQDAQPVWVCPAELDVSALHMLQASLSRAVSPWYLDWSPLKTMAPDAAKDLSGLFAGWCEAPVTLCFAGADVLEKMLKSHTPSGDKQVDSCWWQLRLDALRILRLQDEFELAALDFCVTYEVSPPPWKQARCEFLPERSPVTIASAESPDLLSDFTFSQSADSRQAPTDFLASDSISSSALVELSGEVLGDAAEALDQMQAGLNESHRLVISCARLIRVDFSAAGSILNWVAVRESEGCRVQFRDVPCLVAAFFNVIGINEHARVVLRTN